MQLPTIILASASPRRRDLLSQLGFPFTILPSQLEETITTTVPEKIVQELSFQKAQDIAQKQFSPTLVIGADTIVAFHGAVMGKPRNKDHAFEMIQALQGQTHQVYTGVTLFLQQDSPQIITFSECTEVTMYPMSNQEILSYLTEKELHTYSNFSHPVYQWEDKAGGYGIQTAFGARYIQKIHGDYNNVVGLPIARLYQEMKPFLSIY